MEPAQRERLSEAEYLERERASDEKHELVNGELVAMAGSTRQHSQITANIIRSLGNRFADRPCVVHTSDRRVNVATTRLYAYPDVSVVCGPEQSHPQDHNTLRNPTLIVEVLSDSTELYDRGAKFAHYQNLASMREYLLVSQKERIVERYERIDGDEWRYTRFTGGAIVPLPSVAAELPLDEVYLKVEFAGDGEVA